MRTFFIFLITAFVLAPTVTFAQKYLVGLPIDNQGNFNQYINLLYKMSISIAALLAVVKIIIAGAKYMLSDIVTNKSEAKKDIQGALLGLLLIIGAVIVLNTINPALTDGGLNIRKIVVPELNITPAVVTVAGQSGDQFAADLVAGLSSCLVQSKAKTGSSGRTVVTAVDSSRCTSADNPGALLGAVSTRCRQKGGVPRPSPDGKVIGCAVRADFNEEYRVSDFKTTSDDCLLSIPSTPLGALGPSINLGCTDIVLDNKYAKQDGRLVTYSAEAQCKEQYTSMDLEDCMEEIEDAFSKSDDLDVSGFFQDSYCDQGTIKSRFVCELPSGTSSTTTASN